MSGIYAPCFGWEGYPEEGTVYTDLRRLMWAYEDYRETAGQCYACIEGRPTKIISSGNMLSNAWPQCQDISSGRGEDNCCGFCDGTACGAGGPYGNDFVGYDHAY